MSPWSTNQWCLGFAVASMCMQLYYFVAISLDGDGDGPSSGDMPTLVHRRSGSDEGEPPRAALDEDYVWRRFCKPGPSPCIAILSASHHGGVRSTIDQETLSSVQSRGASTDARSSLRQRILLREAYCVIHGCDVVVDFNDYHENRTMWLSDHGGHRTGPMPPHWNKVAAIRRWLPRFDAVVLMDMDAVWVDFNLSVHELFNATSTIYSNGNPELVLFKREEVSQCIVETWWYYGTGAGCRYKKYPMNYRSQTPNLDMPWFWFALMKCAELYGGERYECLNPCNGPQSYQHTIPDTDKDLKEKWISGCFEKHRNEVTNTLRAVASGWVGNKRLIHEANWGRKIFGATVEEMSKCSIAIHCKDSAEMIDWLNRTLMDVLLPSGCTHQSCAHANTATMHDRLTSGRYKKWDDESQCIDVWFGHLK